MLLMDFGNEICLLELHCNVFVGFVSSKPQFVVFLSFEVSSGRNSIKSFLNQPIDIGLSWTWHRQKGDETLAIGLFHQISSTFLPFHEKPDGIWESANLVCPKGTEFCNVRFIISIERNPFPVMWIKCRSRIPHVGNGGRSGNCLRRAEYKLVCVCQLGEHRLCAFYIWIEKTRKVGLFGWRPGDVFDLNERGTAHTHTVTMRSTIWGGLLCLSGSLNIILFITMMVLQITAVQYLVGEDGV